MRSSIPGSGCPDVVVRASSESLGAPMQIDPPDSVMPKQETCSGVGHRRCISARVSGTPT